MLAKGPQEEEEQQRRWRAALMAFFLRRVRHREEAEDLMQEAFVRLLRSPDALNEGYVFRVAQNLMRDRARRRLVRDRHADAVGLEAEREVDRLTPHVIAAGREELALLAASLSRLPERTRAIFVLFRLENMAQDEIAASYGISTSAVKKHVAKAVETLMRTRRRIG